MRTCIRHRTTHSDGGFSIVEMIIAMFLLAVIALALLPLLVGVTRSSTTNKDLTAATTFANSQLAAVRNAYPTDSTASSCSALRAGFAKTGLTDPAGTGLEADVIISPCPAGTPDVVGVVVKVYRDAGPESVLVTLPTKVLVAKP